LNSKSDSASSIMNNIRKNPEFLPPRSGWMKWAI
jgi:hypothetical protein